MQLSKCPSSFSVWHLPVLLIRSTQKVEETYKNQGIGKWNNKELRRNQKSHKWLFRIFLKLLVLIEKSDCALYYGVLLRVSVSRFVAYKHSFLQPPAHDDPYFHNEITRVTSLLAQWSSSVIFSSFIYELRARSMLILLVRMAWKEIHFVDL